MSQRGPLCVLYLEVRLSKDSQRIPVAKRLGYGHAFDAVQKTTWLINSERLTLCVCIAIVLGRRK